MSALAKAVREDRLWQRHADMAKLGGTPKGGVNRQALSPEDAAARNQLAAWAKARGFAVSTDAIGNLFVRREGSDPSALPVMSGSHMDSQPTGGRFDGTGKVSLPVQRQRFAPAAVNLYVRIFHAAIAIEAGEAGLAFALVIPFAEPAA